MLHVCLPHQQSLIGYAFISDWGTTTGRCLACYGSVAVVCFSQKHNKALPSLRTELRVDNFVVANLQPHLLSCFCWNSSVKRLFQRHNSAIWLLWALH